MAADLIFRISGDVRRMGSAFLEMDRMAEKSAKKWQKLFGGSGSKPSPGNLPNPSGGSNPSPTPDSSSSGSLASIIGMVAKAAPIVAIVGAAAMAAKKIVDNYAKVENKSAIFSSTGNGSVISAGGQAITRRNEDMAYSRITDPKDGKEYGIFNPFGAVEGFFRQMNDQIEISRMETIDSLAQNYLGNYKNFQGTGSTFGSGANDTLFYAQQGARYNIGAGEYSQYMQQYGKMAGESNLSSASGSVRFAAQMADSTGADIGSLLNTLAAFDRYGDKGSLTSLYNGNKSMGGNNATIEEYARAMGKIMQNDISKGIVRGNGDIAKSLTGLGNYMFNASGGNNMAYRNSENVANMAQSMSQTIAGATDVGSATQMMMVRNAAKYLESDRKNITDKLKLQSINTDGMDNMSIVATMMDSGLFTNELAKINQDKIDAMYGKGTYANLMATQQTTGFGLTAAQTYRQGNGADLTAGIGNEAVPTRQHNQADEILERVTVIQNQMAVAGSNVLGQQMENLNTSIAAINQSLEMAVPALKNLNETLSRN